MVWPIIIHLPYFIPRSKLDDLKKELLPLVVKHACVKLKAPIKLASGKMSQTYFDGRKVTLHPKGISLLARAILELVDVNAFHAIGGPSIGADPIATAVSIFALLERKKELPAFLVRKEVKQYGLQKQIEGMELKSGMNVLVVEDVITTGSSVKNAISVIEATGAKVKCVVCLLDREEGGKEMLHSYPLIPLFKRDEIK